MEASRLAGCEIETFAHKCRYECPSLGGPHGGRQMTEEEKGRFMYWMLSSYYRNWSGTHGLDKYLRKLVSNPTFFVPPERDEILSKCENLLRHPNVRTVGLVGSLPIQTVARPLKDHDLMVVLHDFEEYARERDAFRALLPDTHESKTDWFVGCSLSGTLAAVDLVDSTLHLAYRFPHTVGAGISRVVEHKQMGEWPARFQELIDEIKGTRLPTIPGKEVKENWLQGKDLWRKAYSFASSMASGRGVEPEVYEKRHISCHGTKPDGEVVSKPCMYRKASKSRQGHFCGACGCGDSKLANLSPDPKTGKSKLQFVQLTCPLKMEGFSNGPDQS
jgi:hypothetical protein